MKQNNQIKNHMSNLNYLPRLYGYIERKYTCMNCNNFV